MSAAGARNDVIDALRAFALGGIILVNIQSFVYGATHPLGYPQADAGALDRAVYFATAAFVNLKFMPLFAMLFGVGFGLLYQKLSALTDAPATVYVRRMVFLFVFGVLHGSLLYFGDITHLYALAGLVLLRYVEADVAGVRKAAVAWWAGAVAVTGAIIALAWDYAPDPAEIAAEVERNVEVFAYAGYFAQLGARWSAFIDVMVAGLLNFPLTVALMLTGLLAQRAGWLADRDARIWKIAAAVGLAIGLPAGIVYAGWSLADVERDGFGAYSVAATIPMIASLPLAFFHAAMFVRHAPAVIVRWLAPAGRMPLTNYFVQSLAMGALLSGWGLGLAPRLGYAELAGLGLAIFVTQLVASRLWFAYARQGPLEALWRAWTYAGLPGHAHQKRSV
jgi:uncharacterized protein